jgi:hypothetical protein
MATRKTSQLTELAAAPANNDLVMVVDVSDTTMSSSGTNKKVTITNLASAIVAAGSVTSVNGQTGVVVLDSDDIYRTGSSGDTINTDLTAIEGTLTDILSVLKKPSSTTTGLQVNTSNKLEIDSTLAKAVFTIAGVQAATITDSRSLFPALRVGPSGLTYDLPASRGTTTGHVPVYDSSANGSTWQALKVAELTGNSDDLTAGTTNLFLTSAERTKLAGITAGAAVASVTGTAPIVSSGGTSPAISITAATTSAAGSMSASDKTKLDGITAGAAVASVTGTAPIISSGGTTPAISISAATTSAAGSMSSADKTKLDGIAAGAEVNQNAFSNVAVFGQTTVAADTTTGTVTFAQSGGMEITTNATTDTVTFRSKSLDEDDVTLAGTRQIDLNQEGMEIVDLSGVVASFADGVAGLAPDTRIFGGATTGGQMTLFEGQASGANYVGFKAPNTLSANKVWTLPSADGTSGQVLQTNGSATLSFVTKKVTQVTGKTVATGAWSLVSGVYEASISDSAILSTSIVDVIPDNGSAATIRTAQMLPRTDSSTGSVKIYSTNLPGASITVTLNIFDL